MEIKVCVIFVLLVIGVNCNERNVQFEQDTAVSGLKCSPKEQIEGIILTQSIVECTSVCARTDGCKSVFYTHHECVRCRSRYRVSDDARLLPMARSISYRTVVRCNPGWLSFQDSCYLLNSSAPMTFNQTKDYCSSLGAHVLYIDRKEENDVAAHVLNGMAAQGSRYWIGIQKASDGRWISSIDAALVTYFDWAATEPDNYYGNEHCAAHRLRWFDLRCAWAEHAVCEIDM